MRVSAIVIVLLASAACGGGTTIPTRPDASSNGDAGSPGDGGVAVDGANPGDGGQVVDAAQPSDGSRPIDASPMPDAGKDAGGTRSCSQLQADYLAAVAAAKMCNPASLVNPCTVTRPKTIECGCPTYIDAGSTAEIDRITALYDAQNCRVGVCTNVLCVNPGGGSCNPNVGTPNAGTCTDSAGPTP